MVLDDIYLSIFSRICKSFFIHSSQFSYREALLVQYTHMSLSGILSLVFELAHRARVTTSNRMLPFKVPSYTAQVVCITTYGANGTSRCLHHEALLDQLFCKEITKHIETSSKLKSGCGCGNRYQHKHYTNHRNNVTIDRE